MQSERYYVVGQIETAFFELLREKDYTDITVTDIIKKAQVSRGSFYRHYSSISEVMDRAISKGLERITDRSVLEVMLSEDEKRIRDILLRYTYKNLEVHELFASCLPANVAVIFSRIMTTLQNSIRPDTDIPQPEKYRLSARNGVINSILMKWIADGKKETAEEIVNCIMEYVLKL